MPPLVRGLFLASIMLSIVSWYTTFEGMSLYLSRWFALLASLGVQISLVLVAWLLGVSRSRRAQLIAVYGITAAVSVAFSYVSLYRWFSERERPAVVRRQVYDQLAEAAAKTDESLAAASAEARKHTLALEEMTAAEKQHGYISKAADSDPYLHKAREAVAREAGTYREGTGAGIRYTAFERYAKLARESQQSIEQSRAALAGWRSNAKPAEAADKQLRDFHAVYDTIPWSEVNDALHGARAARPEVPSLAANVDQTSGGQEDLLLAFTELIADPTPRHAFSFILAAFLDVIIFLVAYAAGPHMHGATEERATRAAAAIESLDGQVFTRDLLRKVRPAPGGLGRVDAAEVTPGEAQLLIVLAARGQATQVDDPSGTYWLLSPETHEALVDSLSVRGVPLRASKAATA